MTRFRPHRAGLLNLWHHVDQTFCFEDGRLVLRGANGSGKTKALEVLFPLVLDGRLDPRRLDPFSGSARTMRDNLLAGGRETAYGYAWMTFARPDPDERVTIGIGMRAKHDTTDVDTWFFLTDRTPGEDLSLVDDERRPLSRKALAALFGDGSVVASASEHRQAVDKRLFGLGPTRYEAMIELILTLRRPKLATDLDPDRVSDVLTQGLRPLHDDLLVQAARAFEDLEQHRNRLADLDRACKALDDLNQAHRTYARSHAAARLAAWSAAGALVVAHETGIRALEHQHREASARADAARERATLAFEALTRAEAGIRAIEQSDLYRKAGDLVDKRKHVITLKDNAEQAPPPPPAVRRATRHRPARRTEPRAGGRGSHQHLRPRPPRLAARGRCRAPPHRGRLDRQLPRPGPPRPQGRRAPTPGGDHDRAPPGRRLAHSAGPP